MPISRGACRDFLEDFSGFVDGTLDAGRWSLLIAHLDCCEACLRHLRAYRKGVAAFKDAEPHEPAWGLYDRVIERRLAKLSKRVEQKGLFCGLAPFARQLERADDDSRVRRRIAGKIDRAETTRTEIGTNVR